MKERPSYAYSEKLMKRMGWTEGKGLGKNEDGAADFIRVKKKVNTKGIGFNGVDDRWIEHQEAFDSLLSNLNDGKPAANEDKLISVEERAFKLGGRVHYSKFLRGKDLSKKKEEDLNAIVVKRRKKKDSETVQEVDSPSHEDLSGVKTHTSSMSYQEYFAERMKASKRRKGHNEDGDPQAFHHSSDTIDCSGGEHSRMTSGKKHKMYEKNVHAQDDWTCNADENVFEGGIPPNDTSANDACSMEESSVEAKKKSKKSKHKSFDHTEIRLSNSGAERRDDRLEDAAEVVAMPKEHCCEEGVSVRRKKRRHTDDAEHTLHEATESHTEFHPEDSVPQRVKKGSKRKCCDGGEDQGFEAIVSTKKKKKPNHQSAHNTHKPEMRIPEATHPTLLPGHHQRNAKARNDARSHCEDRLEFSKALHLDEPNRGIWRNFFAPNVVLQPVQNKIAKLMAQWVVDTVDNSGVRVTPVKACHLGKEEFAMMLTDHICRQHRRTNWMQIPGYGSSTWVQGVVSFLADRMLLKCSKKA